MTGFAIECVTFQQRVEIVTCVLGVKLARQLHRTQHACIETHAAAPELVFKKTIVETRVMGDEEFTIQPLQHLALDFRKRRRESNHRIGNAGQRLYHGRNAHARIDQR